jgi:adenylate cyclase class IV
MSLIAILAIFIIILVIIIAIQREKLNIFQAKVLTIPTSGGKEKGKAKKKEKMDPIEYEYQFPLEGKDNYKSMVERLKKLDAKREGEYLMSVTVYNTDVKEKEGDMPVYIRVRRETPQMSTFTVKTGSPKFPVEHEIEVSPDQANTLRNMITTMGHTVKYQVDKIREIWTIPAHPEVKEIVFDWYPGLPRFMEVDAHSKEALHKAVDALELSPENRIPTRDEKGVRVDSYKFFYGIPTTAEGRKMPKNARLVFAPEAIEQFEQYLTEEQKKKFNDLITKQMKKADELSK